MSGTCRAGLHAGRHTIWLIKIFVVDAVNAERAFFHHAFGVVIFPCAIGASPGAELAADAGFGIDQHNAIFLALVAGTGWADGDASRVFAMQTRTRHVNNARVGTALFLHFIAMNAIEPGAHGFGRARFGISQGC